MPFKGGRSCGGKTSPNRHPVAAVLDSWYEKCLFSMLCCVFAKCGGVCCGHFGLVCPNDIITEVLFLIQNLSYVSTISVHGLCFHTGSVFIFLWPWMNMQASEAKAMNCPRFVSIGMLCDTCINFWQWSSKWKGIPVQIINLNTLLVHLQRWNNLGLSLRTSCTPSFKWNDIFEYSDSVTRPLAERWWLLSWKYIFCSNSERLLLCHFAF